MAELSIVTKEELQAELLLLKSQILKKASEMIASVYNDNQPKDYLTKEEVTERYGIKSVNTMKKYVKPDSFGNRILFPLSEIKKHMENKEKKKRKSNKK